MFTKLFALAAVPMANGLQVTQILDSVILKQNEYLQLENWNTANSMSSDSTAFN
jgi:hypothetical protein